MLESKYLCTYELLSFIPNLDGSKTVTREIFDWNETMKTSSATAAVYRARIRPQRIAHPDDRTPGAGTRGDAGQDQHR